STNFDGKMGFATADLTIHFLARAKSDVRARARILKKGRRVNVGEVDVLDAEGRPVARALTTYLLTTSRFDYLPGEGR
ncbi:MAG: PaaI family thioesterase, partial [Acidobacteriota bacterium]|nr:PaaI family thioesterase [Acidobacteriota bacterium]